jgi:hypothetical protein
MCFYDGKKKKYALTMKGLLLFYGTGWVGKEKKTLF